MSRTAVKYRTRKNTKTAADTGGRTGAERSLPDRAVLILSVRQTEAFVDAILNPVGPRRVLSAAGRHYKKRVGRQVTG
jgi:hypothetical protein